MKQLICACLTLLIVLQFGLNTSAANTGYEKYGRIAIAVVKADYPNDDVVDYEYKGRTQNPNGQAEDSFQFLVKDQGKERTVKVKIRHDLTNKKMLNLIVEEKGK